MIKQISCVELTAFFPTALVLTNNSLNNANPTPPNSTNNILSKLKKKKIHNAENISL